ncbi:hypothetical protein T265_15793, partial [Opisthorchis viverrini]
YKFACRIAVPPAISLIRVIRFSVDYVIFKLKVHCEDGGESPKDNLNVPFRVDFPESFHDIFPPHHEFRGCPLTLKAATKIECAHKCALNPTCRSIYFKDKEKNGVHMQQADSLLPH